MGTARGGVPNVEKWFRLTPHGARRKNSASKALPDVQGPDAASLARRTPARVSALVWQTNPEREQMTNEESRGTIWTWLRTGWSWLMLAAEAAIAVIWLVTIASGVSGDWPAQSRWVMLLAATSMIVSRRLRVTRPRLSDSLFWVAAIVVIAMNVLSR